MGYQSRDSFYPAADKIASARWADPDYVADTFRYEPGRNLVLSGSMELMGACAVAATAHQWERDRVRAGALAAAGAMLFVFNTQAAQTNLEVQFDAAQNRLELAAASAGNVEADIAEWETEQASITARHDGAIPRTQDAIMATAATILDTEHRAVSLPRKSAPSDDRFLSYRGGV